MMHVPFVGSLPTTQPGLHFAGHDPTVCARAVGVLTGEAPPFIALAIIAAMIGVVGAQIVYADRHGLSRQIVGGRLTALRYSLLVQALFTTTAIIQLLNIAQGTHRLDSAVMTVMLGGCGAILAWFLWAWSYAAEELPRPVDEELDMVRRFVERVLRP